nr:DUF3383 family protein [Bacilli bacterium]
MTKKSNNTALNYLADAVIGSEGDRKIQTTAVVSVDTMELSAEMKVDSGHDLYLATNVTRTGALAISFDSIAGLDLTNIQAVENKTQSWIYSTKGATVTNTTISLVAASQKTGYPAITAGDEIELVYRGTSRLTDKTQMSKLTDGTNEVDVIVQDSAFGTDAKGLALFGKYQAVPTTYSDGDATPILTDANGNIKTNVIGGTISTITNTVTIAGAVTTDVETGLAKETTLGTVNTNLGTIETDIEATNTALGTVNTNLENLNQYSTVSTLVTTQDLTDSYVDFGSEIDVKGYSHLGVYIEADVNDSETVTLDILGRHTTSGDNYSIDGLTAKSLWTTAASDFKKYYEIDVGTIPYIQLQAKAVTVGTAAGYLTGGSSADGTYTNWAVVTDAEFTISIDGSAYDVTSIDFTGVTSMDDVATKIQA